MLIIEGTDGVGKTTLAKELLKALPTHIYAHFTRLPQEFDYFWGYVERMSQHVVQDRFHISEVAYSYARGDQPHFDIETARLLDGKLRLLGAYTVVITADEDLISQRWDPSQMYNLKATLEANKVFTSAVVNHLDLWQFDVDFTTHLTKDHPYVTRHELDQILEGYLRRQRALSAVQSRCRPTSI